MNPSWNLHILLCVGGWRVEVLGLSTVSFRLCFNKLSRNMVQTKWSNDEIYTPKFRNISPRLVKGRDILYVRNYLCLRHAISYSLSYHGTSMTPISWFFVWSYKWQVMFVRGLGYLSLDNLSMASSTKVSFFLLD